MCFTIDNLKEFSTIWLYVLLGKTVKPEDRVGFGSDKEGNVKSCERASEYTGSSVEANSVDAYPRIQAW